MSIKRKSTVLKVCAAQISPIWLDRQKTLEKMLLFVDSAVEQDCDLIVFGEALLPGYPFWIDPTGGAAFNSPVQKEIFAHYCQQAVRIEAGHLQPLLDIAAKGKIAIYAGCVERPADRGGHSLYCSLVYINPWGEIQSVHRKLMPTYEERLTWAPGDGHGLRTHALGEFTVGGLNCWENWMPLARSAMYALGEDLHVAVWPGSIRNTSDITRFIAKESRSYVISASGLIHREDIPESIPYFDLIYNNSPEKITDGGSCIAGPDGEWIAEPLVDQEDLVITEIDHRRVLEERQNFDPAGHYSRPDVLRLKADRKRQSTLSLTDDEGLRQDA